MEGKFSERSEKSLGYWNINMSTIWTPEQLTPDGWDPDEWASAHSWSPKNDEKKTVKVRIVAAKYHEDQETISLLARFPDGSSRTLPINKGVFTLGGKNLKEIPKHESDKEMSKLAHLLNERRGSSISVEAFNVQI
jgi:hypothetical protein